MYKISHPEFEDVYRYDGGSAAGAFLFTISPVQNSPDKTCTP